MNELQSLFDVALADEPPCASGPDRVFARADQLRNRHRLMIAATGLAGALVVAGVAIPVGAAALGGSGSAGTTQGFGAPGVQSGSPSPGGGPASPGGNAPTPGGGTVVTTDGAALLAKLKLLLPGALETSQPKSQDGYAELVVRDSQGKVKLEVNVQPHFGNGGKPGDAPPTTLTCAASTFPAGTDCRDSILPDGTLLLTTAGPNDDPRTPYLRKSYVEIRRPDGLRIVVAQWNAVDESHGQATRPTLLFTLDQLTAIATSPAWLS